MEPKQAIAQFDRDLTAQGGLEALLSDLKSAREAALDNARDLDDDDDDRDDIGEVDVRLGYEPEWSDRIAPERGLHIMIGDPSFDQTHYSFCGEDIVTSDMSDDDLREVARDLADEIRMELGQL